MTDNFAVQLNREGDGSWRWRVYDEQGSQAAAGRADSEDQARAAAGLAYADPRPRTRRRLPVMRF